MCDILTARGLEYFEPHFTILRVLVALVYLSLRTFRTSDHVSTMATRITQIKIPGICPITVSCAELKTA
jgi:hypothetical protein